MDLVDTIKDPSLPVYGGGPSLTDHMVGMYHPTKDRPLFKSVDESMTDPGTYHVTYDKRDKALAEEATGRLGMYMISRFGQSACIPFEKSYIADQKAQFEVKDGIPYSKSDAMLATLIAREAVEGLPDYSDDDSEDDFSDDEDTHHRVIIEDIRFQIPGAFKTRALLAKDALEPNFLLNHWLLWNRLK